MAYTVTSDVKAYGGFTDSDTTDDVLLASLISRSQAMIEIYTDRKFECTSDDESTRYYDGDLDVDGMTLWVDKDLNTINSIKVDGTAIDSDGYVTEPRNDSPYDGITILGSAYDSDDWSYGTDAENSIAVEGQWAYSSVAPTDIKWACERLTVWLYKQRNSDVDLDRPLLTGEGITIMPTTIPSDVAKMLALYKRRYVGGI